MVSRFRHIYEILKDNSLKLSMKHLNSGAVRGTECNKQPTLGYIVFRLILNLDIFSCASLMRLCAYYVYAVIHIKKIQYCFKTSYHNGSTVPL